MKRLFGILTIALLLAGCQREDKSAKLIEEYQALSERVEQEYNQATSQQEADSLVDDYIRQAFAMQQALPESEAAYFILADMYYLLNTAQKTQAFAVLNIDSLEVRGLKQQYDAFMAEQRTAVGNPFTDFTGVMPDGNEASLQHYRSRAEYMLVDFWASWCGPCRRSMPGLKQLLAKYGDRLIIVGVSVDKEEKAWLQAIDELELTWPQIRDVDGVGADLYGITAIPHTVLIANDGTIIARNPSHAEIESLLK